MSFKAQEIHNAVSKYDTFYLHINIPFRELQDFFFEFEDEIALLISIEQKLINQDQSSLFSPLITENYCCCFYLTTVYMQCDVILPHSETCV